MFLISKKPNTSMERIQEDRMIIKGSFSSVALMGMALFISGCSEPVEQVMESPVRPAKILTVSSATDSRQLNLPAVIEASNTSVLTFQVSGNIEELPVTEGQEVTRGTVIARLDQRDYRNNLQQAQAQFSTADTDFQRAARLLEQDAIAKSVYDQRLGALDVARATLDTAQKAFDDTVLRTPFDGIVASVAAEQFDNISPQTQIVTLQTTGAAEAVVQLPSVLVANADRITPRDTYISLDAAEGERVPAEFLSLSTLADASTQTFTGRFKFTPPEGFNILPGMTGSLHATVDLGDESGNVIPQIVIPLAAVLTEAEDKFVWVVDMETMIVSKRSVTLQEGIGEQLVVLAGLSEGEAIVGAGASYLFEGMQIRPYEG
jgi:RND family efflux transporter MFP subunit